MGSLVSCHAGCGCPHTMYALGWCVCRAQGLLACFSESGCVLSRCFCVQDRDSLTTGAVNGYVAGQIYYDAIMVLLPRSYLPAWTSFLTRQPAPRPAAGKYIC